MLTDEEKRKFLLEKSKNLDFHIQGLVDGIAADPNDYEGKTPRAEVLSKYRAEKEVVLGLLEALGE
jgi:hypothetical protein